MPATRIRINQNQFELMMRVITHDMNECILDDPGDDVYYCITVLHQLCAWQK